MKVQLKCNLKVDGGTTLLAGTVFDNGDGAFPEYIVRELNNPNVIKVIDTAPSEHDIDPEDLDSLLESVTVSSESNIEERLQKLRTDEAGFRAYVEGKESVLAEQEKSLAERLQKVEEVEAALIVLEVKLNQREIELDEYHEALTKREALVLKSEAQEEFAPGPDGPQPGELIEPNPDSTVKVEKIETAPAATVVRKRGAAATE